MFEEDRRNIEDSYVEDSSRQDQADRQDQTDRQMLADQQSQADQQVQSDPVPQMYQQARPYQPAQQNGPQAAQRSAGEQYQQRNEAQAAAQSQAAGQYQQSQTRQESSYRQPESGERGYRVSSSHIPEEPRRGRRKKGRSLAARAAGVTAAAVLFGVVAGGTMFGVNALAERLGGRPDSETEQAETRVSLAAPETQAQADVPAAAEAVPAIQMDVSAIVEKAMPSVVAINNTMLLERQTWFGPTQQYEVPSSGSGIIVGKNDDELLIVTNNHVIEDSKELTVTFIDESSVKAVIKGTDSESDLAVIAIPLSDIESETMDKISVAMIGDSDALKVGQGVIAIGNALGYGQSVTVGYVSALDREVKAEDETARHLLQTDAAINPGNSGGALLNMKGEVIGINAAKYSSTSVEGMGYAIPISKAQDIINDLMNRRTHVAVEEAKQGYLGIQGNNIDSTAAAMYDMPRGVYVYKIVEGGAAANSDLREKDIITKFEGETVRTMADLKEMLTYYEGGTTVQLTVQSLENGKYVERTVQVTLGVRGAETN